MRATPDEIATIRADLTQMIAEARAAGHWLVMTYQDVWFSPDELAAENKNGKFLWGRVNWEIRDPLERLAQLKTEARRAGNDRDAFEARLKRSRGE